MTVIPLYDTLGPENLSYCLNHTNMTTVICAQKSVTTLLNTEDLGKLANIIALDEILPE